jgi:alkyl sulfatase BDS1-like metallo-beta-lactamase superfamily hydrolase
MSDQQLDYESAKALPRDKAAFFYRGPSSAVLDDVAFFTTQGNGTVFMCKDRCFVVDTTPQWYCGRTIEDLRANYTQLPVEAIAYTHGHIDHVTGAETYIKDASERGFQRPRIIGHRDISRRFDRYRMMHQQNNFINRVQFNLPANVGAFSTVPWTYPETVYDQSLTMTIGGERFELYHARGETDDETYVWCPNRRVLCTGDTFVWSSPNAGNPYKVQRYASDWATALEHMASLRPLHLLPGHGPPLSGEADIQDALLTTAAFLRSIHDQVVAKMNEGKWLEDILREIDWPSTDHPWLRPIYDHPEFIARNVYRLYGGWYDGNPANMLPAHSHDIAEALIGATGAAPILARARELRDAGEVKLACHLVDFVRKGDGDNVEAWELWRELFTARAAKETSLMARGAFYYAVREAEENLERLRG